MKKAILFFAVISGLLMAQPLKEDSYNWKLLEVASDENSFRQTLRMYVPGGWLVLVVVGGRTLPNFPVTTSMVYIRDENHGW